MTGWYLIGGGVLVLGAVLLAWGLGKSAAAGDRHLEDAYRTSQGRTFTVQREHGVEVWTRPGGATARIDHT